MYRCLVAVRSIVTAEELPDASFAGQQETYLNVERSNDLVKSTIRCCPACSLREPTIIEIKSASNTNNLTCGYD